MVTTILFFVKADGGSGKCEIEMIASLWGGSGAVYMVSEKSNPAVRVCVKFIESEKEDDAIGDDAADDDSPPDFGDRYTRTSTSYKIERKFYQEHSERLLSAGAHILCVDCMADCCARCD